MKKLMVLWSLGMAMAAIAACSHSAYQNEYSDWTSGNKEFKADPWKGDSNRNPSDVGSGYISLNERERNRAELDHCGGSASLVRRGSQLVLVLNNIKDCSKVFINQVDNGKLDRQNNQGFGEVLFNEVVGFNEYFVRLESGSGKTADTIRVTSTKAPALPVANIFLSTSGRKFDRLPECRGTVELKVAGNAINLIFRDVEYCSNFDILSNDGERIDYDAKKLQGANSRFGGSFTLPKRVVDFGHNGVKVIVKSNKGGHDDVIYVQFYAL